MDGLIRRESKSAERAQILSALFRRRFALVRSVGLQAGQAWWTRGRGVFIRVAAEAGVQGGLATRLVFVELAGVQVRVDPLCVDI
jgi:hypothetical protein